MGTPRHGNRQKRALFPLFTLLIHASPDSWVPHFSALLEKWEADHPITRSPDYLSLLSRSSTRSKSARLSYRITICPLLPLYARTRTRMPNDSRN